MLRRALRAATLTGSAAVGAGATALYVDAPDADLGDGKFDAKKTHDTFPEWLHDLGRVPLVVLAFGASKFHLNLFNDVTIEGAEHLLDALEKSPRDRAVITVSNHTATVDDPATMAIILPWKYSLPRNIRWSLVSQEYGYTKGRVLSSLFFGGKVLPIKRGAGVDQPMLKTFFEKVQAGDWVHVFPEGKIQQGEVLGGRTGPSAEEIGRLKWGTAKLIARADVRPIVIPFYHANMQKIMPQDGNRLLSMIPERGVHVTVRVGKPIDFDDLFEEYADCRVVGSQSPWETQEREKAFYSAISKRLETALLELADGIYEKP